MTTDKVLFAMIAMTPSLLGAVSGASGLPGAPSAQESVSMPMSEEELVHFFEGQKRGTLLRIELKGGKVFKGSFRSYDDYEERVWLLPKGEDGLFKEKSVRLAGIQNVQILNAEKEKKTFLLDTIEDPRYELIGKE